MAKNKKSKILASMLAVSTMAVFYAAPIMAAEVDVTSGKLTGVTADNNTDYSFTGGTLNLDDADIAGALNGQNVNLGTGAITANSITSTAVKTTSGADLDVVNNRTQNMTATEDSTIFDGKVTVNGTANITNGHGKYHFDDGLLDFNIDNGKNTFTMNSEHTSMNVGGNTLVLDNSGLTTSGAFKAANGNFDVDTEGNITTVGTVDGVDVSALSTAATDISDLQNKTQNMWAGRDYTTFRGSLSTTGSISSGYGAVQLRGNWGEEAAIDLRDTNNNYATLTATQLANINSVIGEGGVVNGADGSVIGGVRFSGGGDLNNVNHINGALIEAYDADPDNGVSGLRISGVAMENGAIKVNAINGATVNYYGEGGLEISGVGMLNGDVSAQTFNGVSIEKDTDGSAVIGGIDIGNLNENVAAATKNIAGIKRTDSNNDGIDDTTTIENRVSIGRDKFTISGYGDDSFTMDSTAARFAGDVFFNNGYRAKFTYANGTTSLGDLAYNLDDLTAQVNDIYNRTQGIDRDANGNTVISNDGRTWENGTSTVTDNDGATVTVGEDVTIDGGNLNVNNGDLNVGTSGEGGSGSGEGGSTGGNGGNGNFSSDINVGGNANVNGTVTVGDASDGKYTQVGESGMTIVGKDENNNTTTNNISDKGMTVTGENGTNNISDSGMTITGKDGNTTNNISDKGMTVTGSNGTTNISGGDISVDNSVTVAGGSENKTTINNEGITVGDKGTSIKNDSISVGDGGYIGDGDVRSGEGVSLNQTAERVGHLENRVGELEDRIDKVGAMAAAIANLRTMGYDPAAPTEVAVGIGQYRDETGAALGLFHYPNRDFMLSLSVSTSGDEVMGGIGATWKFGRKSPEKVAEIKKAQAEADARRAEEAKLAKAEEMKQAAKEAKIKAQQERHAKLAAERAAQAEAAK